MQIKYSQEKTHITLLVKAMQHDVLLEVHDEGKHKEIRVYLKHSSIHILKEGNRVML